MGEVRTHRPVMLITAVISRFDAAFDWARTKMVESFGPVSFTSDCFEFVETDFYHATMGTNLRKQFFAMENFIDPSQIADIKQTTNLLEVEFAESEFQEKSEFPVSRPINLDPGYISEAKLVLATTKDRDHRIYLQKGIFAEVTLHYHQKKWRSARWTYPDYQREDFQEFFTTCREHLRASFRQ